MIPWLDFKLFGNGYGMGCPVVAAHFHWLPYHHRKGGAFFLVKPYYGAQLYSFHWWVPKEDIIVKGEKFSVLNHVRVGPRVMVAWRAHKMEADMNQDTAFINKFMESLDDPFV